MVASPKSRSVHTLSDTRDCVRKMELFLHQPDLVHVSCGCDLLPSGGDVSDPVRHPMPGVS